jgi:DNA-3-methyladenine glycosylase
VGPRSTLLPRAFFARPSAIVARELIGQLLVRDDVVVCITEVEAYCGPADTASHARHGRTARNEPIWGEPGRVYMYRCYGIHMMLNLVAGEEGRGLAVLVRSGDVLQGMDQVLARRRAAPGPALIAGPGKLAEALALDLSFNAHDVCVPGGLEVRAGPRHDVVVGPRVGIDYASAKDRRAPLRFALAGSRAVTRPAALRKPSRRAEG